MVAAELHPMVPHTLYFLLVSFVVSLVLTGLWTRDPRLLVLRTLALFVKIVAGIALLAAIVLVLEWYFIRPLI
jgi:hypothetical protein